jgi:hypothetical protein
MVIFAGFLVVGFIFLSVWFYQRETPAIVFSYGSTFTPIGGWLIFVAIGLVGTACLTCWNTINGGYFNLATWNSFNSTKYGVNHQLLLIVGAAGNIILMMLAIYCLVLLLNKRDILPKVITGYFVFAVGFSMVYYVIALSVHNNAVNSQAVNSLFRSITVAAIWITYFKKSTRVEETFIVPYPPYNYSYEGPETQSASKN